VCRELPPVRQEPSRRRRRSLPVPEQMAERLGGVAPPVSGSKHDGPSLTSVVRFCTRWEATPTAPRLRLFGPGPRPRHALGSYGRSPVQLGAAPRGDRTRPCLVRRCLVFCSKARSVARIRGARSTARLGRQPLVAAPFSRITGVESKPRSRARHYAPTRTPPAPPRSDRGSDAGTRDGARVVHGCDPEPRGAKIAHRQTPPARGVDDDHSDRPKHHRRPGTGPRHDQVTEGDATAAWEGLVRDHTRAGCSAGPR
jgi:hypothetical protein